MNAEQIANNLFSTGIMLMSFGFFQMSKAFDDIDPSQKLKYCINGSAVCFIGGTVIELIKSR
jgi:hypothetical protein